MGLTNKQFDAVLHHYDELRIQSRNTQIQHKKEIEEKLPSYIEMESQIRALRSKRLEASLNNDFDMLGQLKEQEYALIMQRDLILVEAGYPADYLEQTYQCKICQDTGFLPNTRTKCSCFIKQQTLLLFEQSGIAELIQEQNFDTLSFSYFNEKEHADFSNALTLSKNFVKNFDKDYQNILFYGNVGTGKTFLSCCIAKELMETGHSVLYLSADQLFKNFVDLRFQNDRGEYFSFTEDIEQCDLLIIDDLGTESLSERSKADLFTCLNNRDFNKKSTLISTNLKVEEIGNRYSERILSRLSSHFEFRKFDGRDIRMLKKFQEKRK